MTNEYTVEIPIAGTITFTVKASSEKKAKEEAWAHYENNTQTPTPNWEAHEELVTGNCQNYDENETIVTKVGE